MRSEKNSLLLRNVDSRPEDGHGRARVAEGNVTGVIAYSISTWRYHVHQFVEIGIIIFTVPGIYTYGNYVSYTNFNCFVHPKTLA